MLTQYSDNVKIEIEFVNTFTERKSGLIAEMNGVKQ